MAITITEAGTYTVIPGETYTISPGLSGTVNFNAPTGTDGPADFTVNVDQSIGKNVQINFNASTNGATLNPSVNIAQGVDAIKLNFNVNDNQNFGHLSYTLADDAKIGGLEGVNGSDPGVTKTTISGGNNVTIKEINGGSAGTDVALGDNATISNNVNSNSGGMAFEAGDNLKAVDFNMPTSGPNYSVEVGNNANIQHILMGGGYGDKSVVLGEGARTGDISIGGSGTSDDHMDIKIEIGDGSVIGANGAGNISLGGSNVDRKINIGDNVHVEGRLAMGGSDGINNVTIGDNYTQDGYFTGSTSGSHDTIVIGNDWQFNSTFTLQSGDDSLTLGSTTRDTSGTIAGGDGADTLRITVPADEQDAFDEAAQAAGWTKTGDGYNTNGKSLTWKGITYSQWESATSVPCFVAGTLITTDRGEVAVEHLSVGDLVATADHGYRPIRWIGSHKLDAIDLRMKPNLKPIRIRAGVLGAGPPEQELMVSPQHRVLVRSEIAGTMFGSCEGLVGAKQLLIVEGIDVAEDVSEVEYWHFMLDKHEIIFSNGAQTESLYTGAEALKSVGHLARKEIFALFPDLRTRDPDVHPEGARPFLSGRQGRKLAQRHAQKHRELVEKPGI
ncbi:MAG: Hint domain-containing protein [Pseudotabrizicola sp.]|uniref:Hint domain-containing protein n=1 Tax=Pseudotabrizicola sp. TaxID=2939647 RepID=UPI002724592F|nr:Hint domain-containing protein [Pseudotabrizicola sp.]MDO9638326.1 Hint domain-containing protein [Pseudotabrizicola sp.]